MTLSRVLRGALVGAVAVSVTLSGCTADEPTPATSATSAAPTEEPTGEPTAEPTAIVPPEQPPIMATNDAIGARAAAEYFIQLRTYAVASQDLEGFRERSSDTCLFCSNTMALVESDASNGFSTTGGAASFEVQTVTPLPDGSSYSIQGLLSQEAATTIDAAGALIEESPAQAEIPFIVFVEFYEGQGWLFLDADQA